MRRQSLISAVDISNKYMKSLFLAVRAVGVEFARRIFVIAALIAVGASIALIILIVWLTSLSGWWWILATVIIAAISMALLGLFFARAVMKWIAPRLTRDQKRQTRVVVENLQKLSEVTQTPKPLLLFFLVRDVIFPKEDGYIVTLTQEASSVKHDFIALVQSFR